MTQQTHFFVAIYEGQTVSDARIVGATTDPNLVKLVFQSLAGLNKPHKQHHDRRKRRGGRPRKRLL